MCGLDVGGKGGGALLFGGGGISLRGVDAVEEFGVSPALLSLVSDLAEFCLGGKEGLDDDASGIGGGHILVLFILSLFCSFSASFKLLRL